MFDTTRNWHDAPPTIDELCEHHARVQRNPKMAERIKRALETTDGDTEIRP